MPELPDDMYCSQQIMVPPMFPYILRQYAKAAIRSQPTDLLRWSTAYFRCLSLNLPPPVKPRLEYPLPKDYDGVTPGWLRALLYQLANNSHVDFKVLWDRWIGACQNHLTLIKMLCLGGFTDAMTIPLLRFIGLCVGFLCENLTQTMILFCEVVTEEPEGGSAMISLETFIDVYTFLAAIDASRDQVLLNRYFPDELLALLEKKAQKKEGFIDEDKSAKKDQQEKMVSIASEIVEEEAKVEEDQKDVVSCPDLQDDRIEDLSDDSDDVEQGSKSTLTDDNQRIAEAMGKTISPGEDEKIKGMSDRSNSQIGEDEEDFQLYTAGVDLMGEASYTKSSTTAKETVDDEVTEIKDDTDMDQSYIQDPEQGSITSITDQYKDKEKVDERESQEEPDESKEKQKSKEDLVHEDVSPRSPQASTAKQEGGTDAEASKGSEKEYLDISSTDVDVSSGILKKTSGEELGEFSIQEPEAPEEQENEELVIGGKFTVEEVFVEAIPGIGRVVNNDLVKVVVQYMKVCAGQQQGMVMPRNVRHYSCPPLESYQ